jgi:hypothetical protein
MLLFYFILFSAIVIKKDEPGNPSAIGYSGPTYIAIRSAKRSSSTALATALILILFWICLSWSNE